MPGVACDRLRELCVLIVEDNPGDRFLYKQMLVEADPATQYTFDEAATGAEALRLLARTTPDCVLLNYLLPDMLGVELLKALTTQHRPLPAILMLTGFGVDTKNVGALHGGAHAYITKRGLTGAALSRAVNSGLRACNNHRMLVRTRQQMAERNHELEQKYQQVGAFYRELFARLQQPVRSMHDRIAAMAQMGAPAAGVQFRAEIHKLQADSERLMTALGNMLDRPDSDDSQLRQLLVCAHPIAIMEIIADTLKVFRPVAEAAAVRLFVQLQPDLPAVQADRRLIEQVLANLLDNAIRHTPERGQVFLKVDRFPTAPEEISIAVIDTGKGIHPNRLATLFGRQPSAMVTAARGSPDMGLYLCREIIRAHKGRIAAQSLLQAGTCITFTLPVAPRAASAHKGRKQMAPRVTEVLPRREDAGDWQPFTADRWLLPDRSRKSSPRQIRS